MTIDVTPQRFLHDLDLIAETRSLNPEDKARATRMQARPWHTEFLAAPVRLTVDSGQSASPQTYSGTGIVEFMDLHLTPR
jgi:hypothetical protein